MLSIWRCPDILCGRIRVRSLPQNKFLGSIQHERMLLYKASSMNVNRTTDFSSHTVMTVTGPRWMEWSRLEPSFPTDVNITSQRETFWRRSPDLKCLHDAQTFSVQVNLSITTIVFFAIVWFPRKGGLLAVPLQLLDQTQKMMLYWFNCQLPSFGRPVRSGPQSP